MKTIFKIIVAMAISVNVLANTFTNRFSLVQISTVTGDIWGLTTNTNWGTVDAAVAGLAQYNVFTTTNTFAGAVYFPNMSPGANFTVDPTGLLIGQASGSGGGSSTLAVFNGTSGNSGVAVSSPTSGENDNNADFTDTLQGGSTLYRTINPASTKFIHNGSSAQTAAMNISTATIGNVTISTLTVLFSATIANVNISGQTLAYASGTFVNSVAIGTTNVNGQSLRVIDNGAGLNTYESPNNITLFHNIENNTAGTTANIATEILGAGGDSATGAKAGDGMVRAQNALYLVAGGPASQKGVKISTGGISTMYFADGSTQTTAGGALSGTIQNTSTLQAGSTFYVSSGTVTGNLSVGTVSLSNPSYGSSFFTGNDFLTGAFGIISPYNIDIAPEWNPPNYPTGSAFVFNDAGSGSVFQLNYVDGSGIQPAIYLSGISGNAYLQAAAHSGNNQTYTFPTNTPSTTLPLVMTSTGQINPSNIISSSISFTAPGTNGGPGALNVTYEARLGTATISGISGLNALTVTAGNEFINSGGLHVQGLGGDGGAAVQASNSNSSAATHFGTLVNVNGINGGATNIAGSFSASGGGTNIGLAVTAGLTQISSTTVSGYFQLQSLPHAVIQAQTPTGPFQEYGCSDCSTVPVCISTGTVLGAWSLITSKTSACQ